MSELNILAEVETVLEHWEERKATIINISSVLLDRGHFVRYDSLIETLDEINSFVADLEYIVNKYKPNKLEQTNGDN